MGSYYANASKTWVVIMDEFQSEADAIFGNTQVKDVHIWVHL